MTHKRNVEGLRQNAQARRQQALRRTEEGIRKLMQTKRPITFKSVSEVAGVSTAWLYQQPEIKQQILRLREEGAQQKLPRSKTRTSSDSKDAMIMTLRQRVKSLEVKNQELEKRIEVLCGHIIQLQHIH
jgi:hypothetical protein